MEKKLAYRVEHETNKTGPYSWIIGGTLGTKHSDDKHPNFLCDIELHGSKLVKYETFKLYACLFGFSSLDQLFRWFDDEDIELLKEHNYLVATYEVIKDYCAESNYQMIFYKSASKLIDRVYF